MMILSCFIKAPFVLCIHAFPSPFVLWLHLDLYPLRRSDMGCLPGLHWYYPSSLICPCCCCHQHPLISATIWLPISSSKFSALWNTWLCRFDIYILCNWFWLGLKLRLVAFFCFLNSICPRFCYYLRTVFAPAFTIFPLRNYQLGRSKLVDHVRDDDAGVWVRKCGR